MNRREFTIAALAASILGVVRPEIAASPIASVVPIPDWLKMWLPYIKKIAKRAPYCFPTDEQKIRFSAQIAAVEEHGIRMEQEWERRLIDSNDATSISDWLAENPIPSKAHEELIGLENAIAFYESQRSKIHNMPVRYSDEDSVLEQQSIDEWEKSFWTPANSTSFS